MCFLKRKVLRVSWGSVGGEGSIGCPFKGPGSIPGSVWAYFRDLLGGLLRIPKHLDTLA